MYFTGRCGPDATMCVCVCVCVYVCVCVVAYRENLGLDTVEKKDMFKIIEESYAFARRLEFWSECRCYSVFLKCLNNTLILFMLCQLIRGCPSPYNRKRRRMLTRIDNKDK